MRKWNEYCIIDILSQIDPSMLEDDTIEEDLTNLTLWQTEKEKWSKRKIAVLTGIAAGTVALTGAVVLLCKKNNWPKKAA